MTRFKLATLALTLAFAACTKPTATGSTDNWGSDAGSLPQTQPLAPGKLGAVVPSGANVYPRGFYNASPPAPTSGDSVNLQTDSSGNLKIAGTITATVDTSLISTSANQTNGTQKAQRVDGSGNVAPAGDTVGRSGFTRITDGVTTAAVDVTTTALKVLEQNQDVFVDNTAGVAVVEHRYSGANMTTATTTTIKSGAGLLHTVNVGTCVSGATVSLFDNTAGSGTSISVITCPAATAGMSTFIFDRSFSTGLTAVTSGATNVSFSYR